nr:replication protein P [Serratia liquefaciens]
MTKIYSNRWIAKNGNRPSALWEQQIGAMTSEQLTRVCNACVERCTSGNTWPPDFAEFVALVAEAGGGKLGLTVADVTAEYKRWKSESWRYNSSEQFPWKHPVLYHICVEMRREGVERKLTQPEMEKLAGTKLGRWEKKIASGYSVPPIRRQIAAPTRPDGPTPAQEKYAEYLRRKAAGLVK